MKDPFKTLGIPSTASEDEIKSAYRKLAKQYHPDLHPGDRTAEEKMKEVNEAYAEAIRVKKQGGYRPDMYGERAEQTQRNPYGSSSSSSPFGSAWGPFETQWGGSSWNPFGTQTQSGTYSDARMQAAADYIQTGRYQEALNILQNMQSDSAPWHYLNALAHKGLGNQIAALSHARQAVQMDPNNLTYRQLLNSLQGPSREYQQRGGNPFSRTMCTASPCLSFVMINMLLNCLCGRGRWFLCC